MSVKVLYRHFFTSTFLTGRFFFIWSICAAVFVLSYSLAFLFPAAVLVFTALLFFTAIDFFLVKNQESYIVCSRSVPKVLPLGNEATISIFVKNSSRQAIRAVIIDELPEEFQRRDFRIVLSLNAGTEKTVRYTVRALSRGAYQFGHCNVFITTRLRLIEHKIVYERETAVPVFPSTVEVRKHELLLFNKLHTYQGIKRIRRIGHSYAFEQIKNYVPGDDMRTINWKATGRRSQLMVNQFGDERSQQVYSVLDKSRAMDLPFNGLSLLDYAINATLVISNTAIRKDDKAGILTFHEKTGAYVKAGRQPGQLKLISETLYKEKESRFEANFELLYYAVTKLIKHRSLIILYTNFESYYTLERYLPVLRSINRSHLLLTVVFKNTEIERHGYEKAVDIQDIYSKTIAKKFLSEKEMMVKELAKYGIQSILTAPEELSTLTINKYLELKAKGLI
jgi:uncharacterized protein (DUF58 family)